MRADEPTGHRTGVAGVVVLYNSPPDRWQNVLTYLSQVAKLYVIDNSPTTAQWLTDTLPAYPTVEYQHFPQNVGLATALNTAARLALGEGYAYLLTMDDDSRAPADLVETMLRYLATVPADPVGIVSPKHVLTTAPPPRTPAETAPTTVLTTMTSGNLLNLHAYQQVGPFLDALFIDVVDHEFNLRLNERGYRVVELPQLRLTHTLGAQRSIPFTRRTYVTHSPIRNYYLVRNSLAVALRHRRHRPTYLLTALQTIGIETIKAALFENERLLRLRLIGRAIGDGLRNRLGKRTANPA